MDAGKLNTRININRYTKTVDDFGGYNSTSSIFKSIWCYLKEIKGEIKADEGMNKRRVNAEIIARKTAVDDIIIGDTFNIEGQTEQYKINDLYQSEFDFYVTIKATKVD